MAAEEAMGESGGGGGRWGLSDIFQAVLAVVVELSSEGSEVLVQARIRIGWVKTGSSEGNKILISKRSWGLGRSQDAHRGPSR